MRRCRALVTAQPMVIAVLDGLGGAWRTTPSHSWCQVQPCRFPLPLPAALLFKPCVRGNAASSAIC